MLGFAIQLCAVRILGAFRPLRPGIWTAPWRAFSFHCTLHPKIDMVLVSELSRWGRSTLDLRSTVEELADRQVAIRALNGPDIDISTAQGKLMLNMLAAISEFEGDLLRERIKSGISHARSKGTKSGRAIGRPAFDRTDRVKRLLAKGRSVRTVAAELGISKTTVMKVKSASAHDSADIGLV